MQILSIFLRLFRGIGGREAFLSAISREGVLRMWFIYPVSSYCLGTIVVGLLGLGPAQVNQDQFRCKKAM